MFKKLKCIAFLAIALAIPVSVNASVVVDDFSAVATVGGDLATAFGSVSIANDGGAAISGTIGTGYVVDVTGVGVGGATASLTYNFTSGFSSVVASEPDALVNIFAPVFANDPFSLSVSYVDGNGQTYLHGTSATVGNATLGTSTDPLALSTGRTVSELTGLDDISQIRFDFIYTGSAFPVGPQILNFGGGTAGGFIVATPEPTSFMLFGISAFGLAFRRRKK